MKENNVIAFSESTLEENGCTKATDQSIHEDSCAKTDVQSKSDVIAQELGAIAVGISCGALGYKVSKLLFPLICRKLAKKVENLCSK